MIIYVPTLIDWEDYNVLDMVFKTEEEALAYAKHVKETTKYDLTETLIYSYHIIRIEKVTLKE